ncbi:MAG: hypothetical protein KF695_09070 [Simplicispira sp.]|nr:hypothetical protein [Simplicispira sp.]
MPLHHTLAASGAALLAVLALAGCSDKAKEPAQAVQQAVEKVTGKNKIKMKGNTPLDAAAYSITSVMSGKFKDYQISDSTVRLIVKDGTTLSGSECTIINAATKADHPNVIFIIDDGGKTITC